MDDIRLKKIRYRAWHRGFREADLILGPFAERYCPDFTDAQLDAFEVLLEENDHDIYAWIVGRQITPPQFEGELMDMLKAFEPFQHRGPHGA